MLEFLKNNLSSHKKTSRTSSCSLSNASLLSSVNFNLNVNKDGSFELVSNNVQITTNSNDEVSITNGKATVKIDSSGNVTVETSGKYKFKNNTTDLKSVIDGLAKEVENLITIGSPAKQSTSPATKALITTWRQSKLNLLLD